MTKKQTTVTHLREFKTSLQGLRKQAYNCLNSSFSVESGSLYIRDIFVGHPALGDCVIVEWSTDMSTYAVGFAEVGGSIVLALTPDWRKVEQSYVLVGTTASVVNEDEANTSESELAECNFTENDLGEVTIEEADLAVTDKYAPLTMTVRLIKKGFGNGRDNHYYSEAQLRADAPKFKGVMMYTTNHLASETNERNQVSVIKESWYDDKLEGIVGKVVVFDPNFAHKTRNRKEADVLEMLHCSIKAKGTTYVKPFTKGERTGKQVKEFTKVNTVDWVSSAGAGGVAISAMN